MAQRHQSGHVQRVSQCRVAGSAEHAASLDRRAREPESRTHADEGRQRLGVAEAAHVADVGQELGDGDIAQSGDAADQFGILAQARMPVDMIVDLPLQLVDVRL